MTTVVKAFVEIASLIDNGVDSVAGVGELSETSKTFSTDKRYHQMDAFPGLNLVVFECIKNGTRSELTAGTKTKIFEVSDDLINDFDGQKTGAQWFADERPEFNNVVAGSTVIYQNQAYLNYFKGTFDDAGETVTLQVWFTDLAISSGNNYYDSFEIRVVPPVIPVNNLYNPYSVVASELARVTPVVANNNRKATLGTTQATEENVYELRWVDKDNPASTVTTYWTVLCYGPKASHSENIIAAIRAYLVDNTGFTLEQWRAYLPDILTLENFTVVPLWDKIALGVSSVVTPAFSPITRIRELSEGIGKLLPTLDSTEILEKGETVPHIWNGINLYVIAGTGNGAAAQYFSDVYSDYNLLRQGDQNLSLVSAATLEAIQTLELLLMLGENYTTGSVTLPTGVTEVVSGGALFLEKTVDGMALRVMTKTSYLATIND